MKTLKALCVMIAFIYAPFVIGAEDDSVLAHVSGFPIYEGLVEDTERGLMFDKPDGRILEAWLYGIARKTDVIAFYDEALGQLGWQRQADQEADHQIFTRGDEILHLTYVENDGQLSLGVYLAPISEQPHQ